MTTDEKSLWVSIAAVAIALGALGVTCYQSWINHQQLVVSQYQFLLSIKPSVNFDTEYDPDDLPLGIEIDNAGPGPAVIKSMMFYVDRKAVSSAPDALLTFVGLDDADYATGTELEKEDTLAVGEKQWLLVYKSKPHGKQQQDEQDKFVDLIGHHVAVAIEFCSVMGDHCEKKCSTDGWCE